MMTKYTKAQQKRNRAKWVKALRSGEYRQTKSVLTNGNGFCCLGVACEISGLGHWAGDGEWEYRTKGSSPDTAFLPNAVRDWLGLATTGGDFGATSLTHLNDTGKRFPAIARIIESEPEGLLAPVAGLERVG
jgi:hypothetical protein